jgi:hypothetical protein
MTVRTARTALSAAWFVGSVPLFLLVALQTVRHVYGTGENWDKGALWIMPLLLPVLGTIVGALYVGHNESDDLRLSSTNSFWLTFVLIVVYFVILYGSMITGINAASPERNDWTSIISSSTWILGNLQWMISFALTKFFIEHIRVKQLDVPNNK